VFSSCSKPASTELYYLQVARRLFSSEAEILEQLGNHDQIPRLLAYFEVDEPFFLVQDISCRTSTQRGNAIESKLE
jgi:serine/threonine protein kinase